MFTQCPSCRTLYQPTPSQLAQARGRLFCVVCNRDFDGLEWLSERPGTDRPAHPALLDASVPASEQGDLFAVEQPAFAKSPPVGPRTWPWWTGSAVLLLALLAQIGLAERDRLAAHPGWRPAVAAVAGWLGLELDAPRAFDQLRLIARDVRPHPSVPDALLVSASFRNDAPVPQAFPLIELALSDIDGNPLALRRFRAEEYMGLPPQNLLLDPGQSVSATLELQDPGKEAIAFAFEFR